MYVLIIFVHLIIQILILSGESAFHSFLKYLGWPKNPMIHKYDSIHESLPITVIYGKDSWIDKGPGYELQKKRENMNYINIRVRIKQQFLEVTNNACIDNPPSWSSSVFRPTRAV